MFYYWFLYTRTRFTSGVLTSSVYIRHRPKWPLYEVFPQQVYKWMVEKNLCTSLIRFYQNKFSKVTRKERKKQINTKYAGHCTKVRSYIVTAWPQGSPSTPDVTRRLMTDSCRHLSVMIPLLARWRDIRQVSICHHAYALEWSWGKARPVQKLKWVWIRDNNWETYLKLLLKILAFLSPDIPASDCYPYVP